MDRLENNNISERLILQNEELIYRPLSITTPDERGF